MKYIWEDPLIVSENKEDGHVIALPYAAQCDRAAAGGPRKRL